MGCSGNCKDWITGVCDVCRINNADTSKKKVYYCKLCKANICKTHDTQYINRGIAFIKSLINPNIMNTKPPSPEKKFVIKKGSLIRLKGTNIDYNNSTITDQIAKNIIRESPGHIKFFEKVDQAWLDDFMGDRAQASTEASTFEEPVTITTSKAKAALPEDEVTTSVPRELLSYKNLKKIIENSDSIEHITKLIEGDKRVKVQQAAKKRIKQLNTA